MMKRRTRLLSLSILLALPSVLLQAQTDTSAVKQHLPEDTIPTSYHVLYQFQKRNRITGAVAELPGNDLDKTVSASFAGFMTGRLAGLYTTQGTGEPQNDDVSLFLRGQVPFVLVDGTPQSFNSINPEQIESITVLKDALSTAMLGMRGGNGAVLITTRKGANESQKIAFSARYGIQQPTKLPEFVNAYDYARLYNEALANDGKPAVYSAADLKAYQDGTDPIGHPNVDWQDRLLRKSTPFSRYDLAVSGGNKTARYFVNLDYFSQNGIFKTEDFNNIYNTNAKYDRYILRTNVEMDLNKTITASVNLFGRIQNTNQPGATNGTIFTNFKNTPALAYPVRNDDNSLGGNSDYTNNIYAQSVLSGYQPIYERDFKADLSLKAKLDAVTKGLWVKVLGALNGYHREQINRSKTFAVYKQTNTGGTPSYGQFGTFGDQSNSIAIAAQNRLFYAEASAGYNTHIGNHGIEALVVASNDYRMSNSDLAFNYSGVSAKVSYDYKEKYIAEIAAGYNGTERYPKNKRYGLFPALGLGWNISNEQFLKGKAAWINSLKLRASYGKSGNANIGYYEYNQYFTTGTGYGFGNSVPVSNTTLQQDVLANPMITWEKARKFSAGIDGEFFNRKLQFTIDYFNDKYYDLVQQRTNGSDIFGADYARQNLGENRFSGLEISASWTVKKGSFSWFVAPNFSIIKSKVLYLAEPQYMYAYMARTGKPVGQLYGYVAEGLFSSQADIASHAFQGASIQPGDIKYRDLNNDGKIDSYDQTTIGNSKPMLLFGLNTGITVKGFDLTVLVQGVTNRSVMLTGNNVLSFQNNGRGQAYTTALDHWTPDNLNAAYPRLWVGNNYNNTLASTYWVRKGDYLRVKSVELGYSLPQSIIRKAHLTVSRFFVNATNLFTFTGLDNMDPDNITYAYPVMKTFNAGLSIKF
jgi:TonB-linked SusC/RagA family outer membrane protein